MPDERWLILVPTDFELEIIRKTNPGFGSAFEPAICGFGPVAAAARTSQLIAAHAPSQVLLLGIAGSYRASIPIGEARCFSRVACHGIGVGCQEDFQSAHSLGWSQFRSNELTIGDDVELAAHGPTPGTLLTVCSASANPSDVSFRLQGCPSAVAEDMEGFGVALGCALAGVDCIVVRGISNQAGDRNKDNWQVESALRSAVNLTSRIIEKVSRET